MDPDRLAELLADQGVLTDPRWRAALHAVPRHLFVPAVAWARPDRLAGVGHRIDLARDPVRWWETVYSDAVIVIQIDDGAGDPALGEGQATSSVSAPGIVVVMGELLGVRPGDRVLEVGTGSGWTAALLAHLAGPGGGVLSLEVDPVLAARAIEHLAGLTGLTGLPEIRVEDAAVATLDPASYDRLHVACGVDEIPWSWVEALRIGGTGVVPWCPPFGIGNRLRFTRTGPEEAVGALHGPCGFMMMRSQRTELGRVSDFLHDWDLRETRPAGLHPQLLVCDPLGDWRGHGGDTAIAAMVPGVAYWLRDGDLLLYESHPGARENGSWALAHGGEVASVGPRDLWAEVTRAWLRWVELGRPARTDLRMTITPAGSRLWSGDPGTGSL
ncbi:MAG: protein-L-isoaspartate(D-aspartate) O-methyltransferase [Streptosporangiaceae bacterium]